MRGGAMGSRSWRRSSSAGPPASAAFARASAAERCLHAQAEIGAILAEADTVRGMMARLLTAVGETLDWDFAAAWTLDRSAGVLRCLDVWHRPGVDAAELEG